jgi:hypothetical protein
MSEKQSNDTIKREIIKALEKNTTRDYVSVVLKSGLANLPFVGSAIVELMDFYIPDSKGKRLLEFVADLRIDIDKVKDTIDKDVVKTDEFAYLFEQTFRAVYENYQKEKIDAFRALLVNAMIKTDVEAEQQELFLNTLKSLSLIHLRFLKMFYNPKRHVEENKISISPNIVSSGTIKMLKELFPQYDESQIYTVINDLYNAGLINLPSNSLGAGGAWGLQMVENRLTTFGKSLLNFITLE